MTVGEFGKGAGQPVMRVDAGELAVLDQRRDHRPVVAALVGAGEQGILAIQSDCVNRLRDWAPIGTNSLSNSMIVAGQDWDPIHAVASRRMLTARSTVPPTRAFASVEVMAADAEDFLLLLNRTERRRCQRAPTWEARIAWIRAAAIVGAIAAAWSDREARPADRT